MPAPESARRPNYDLVSPAVEAREAVRAERIKIAKVKARQERREAYLSHAMIILFCALLGSGIIWLIAQIWQHMPF